MLFADNIISGPWAGSLGADPLVPQGFQKGVDFQCNTSICFAVERPGTADTAYKNLQRAINRWSGKGKFASLKVDGFIGADTVGGLQKAGNAMMEPLPAAVKVLAKALFEKSLSKENTAQFASELTKQLNAAADKLESAGALPAPRQEQEQAPAPPADVATTGPQAPPAAGGGVLVPKPDAGPQEKSNLVWWVLGGFAAVATAGVVTVVVLRRRRRMTTSTMTPVKGRRSFSTRPGRRASAY